MRYINSFESKALFQRMRRSDYFVDKSGLVSSITPVFCTQYREKCHWNWEVFPISSDIFCSEKSTGSRLFFDFCHNFSDLSLA